MSKTAPRHGTINGYRNDGCRCIHCKAAKKHYERDRRSAYLAGANISHGTRSAWDAGCRCDECRAARRDAERVYTATETGRFKQQLRGRRKSHRTRGTFTVRCHVCDCHVGLSRDGRIPSHKVGYDACGGSGYMPRRAAA